jgi:hypothetical protein
MSLSDLAAIGSFVSGFAVLVSLVFLYFQLRQVNAQVVQAEKNQQATIRQARASRTIEVMLAASEPSLAGAIHKAFGGGAEMSDTEIGQFTQFCRASFYNWEDSFYQHREGLLDDAAFDAFERSIQSVISNVAMRAGWRMQRRAFGPAFVEWLDSQHVQTPLVTLDRQSSWRKALDAERSGASY